MPEVAWDIRREGRSWNAGEIEQRWNLTPEKMEMIGGKVFWTDEDRLKMLGLLLENDHRDDLTFFIREGKP